MNLLVPTDFTPGSLKLAENAVRHENDNRFNIILFHAFELPSSPFDLLANDACDPSASLLTEEFRQACKQLKNQYPRQIGKIMVKCMHGHTNALFHNFIDANDIDLIGCPEEYVFVRIHKRSLDPRPLFRNCGIPVLRSAIRRREPVFGIEREITSHLQLSTN